MPLRLASSARSPYIDASAEEVSEEESDNMDSSEEQKMNDFIAPSDESSQDETCKPAVTKKRRRVEVEASEASSKAEPTRLSELVKSRPKKRRGGPNKKKRLNLYSLTLGTADPSKLPPIYYSTKVGDEDYQNFCRFIHNKKTMSSNVGDLCGLPYASTSCLGTVAPVCGRCFFKVFSVKKADAADTDDSPLYAKAQEAVAAWNTYCLSDKVDAPKVSSAMKTQYRSLAETIASL